MVKQPKSAKIVYLISPKKIYKNFYYDLNRVLKSKIVKFFQLRLKKEKKYFIESHLKIIKKITKKNKVKLILNDDPYLAKKYNLDGCHLGQKDTEMRKARKLIKKKIIGITCHNSIDLVKGAIKNKADYIALGSFYKSNLKPKAIRIDLKTLGKIRKKTKLPIVGIGGITNKNFKNVLKFGANYIAISSFIWNNRTLKPFEAIEKFKV